MIIIANNLKAFLCIQSKQTEMPLLEHWSHDGHRDPTSLRTRAIIFPKWDPEQQQKCPWLQRAAWGRVKEQLSAPFPNPTVGMHFHIRTGDSV